MPFRKSLARGRSLAICAALYAACGAASVLAARAFGLEDPILVAAAADVIATALVFAASAIFDNSSLYDPYWSVAPVPIAAYWAAVGAAGGPMLTVRGAVVLFLLAVWAVRLTYNWVRRWGGLGHEDWRYAEFRRHGPAAYWAVSFIGFHLMPTVLVFFGCLSLYPVFADPVLPIHVLDMVALAVTAGAVFIEARADFELRRFLRSASTAGGILDTGLWSLSRHPNYFGEVLFWWGLFLFGLAANPGWWWTVVGPIAITLLFLVVSVPMMERHMIAQHPGYAERQGSRSAFLLWFPRSRMGKG